MSQENIDAHPHVLVEHLQRGRSRETGLSFDVRHWSVFTFTNGKTTLWCSYQTREQALEAVGLSE
jgi:hypothetical protein